MELIISEKPSTARILAQVLGAREKIFGDGKEYCYKGNGYYVVNARGHLYGLGQPADYGYSKKYKLDELPMFPDFDIIPCGDDTENLRRLISQLMALDEVSGIINACDAGREGELIFRHIYNFNNCQKPVRRLWCNSMTDEAINECMKNLPPDSDFDGEYYAALAREKSDWIIGMNLSRLYGIKDDYTHKIGRVKTPVLAIIAERDNEIANFKKTVTYRLEMESGALSDEIFTDRSEAEKMLNIINGKTAKVLSAVTEEKKLNRPMLYSLTALQQEANKVYGMTAKEVLDTAQSLYEKKLITYPRTDCPFISEDMKSKVVSVAEVIGERKEYSERVSRLTAQGLNLDSRVINSKAMAGHDHHAIIPEAHSDGISSLTDKEAKIYGLIVNRFLCSLDRQHSYKETNYEIWLEDIIFRLKKVTVTENGWKEYDLTDSKESDISFGYAENDTFSSSVSLKEIVSQPKKHYTDATLLSVMNNIDNRIDDKELKSAVSGKGIGTESTRAEVIEQLIAADYVCRKGREIISTDFGREFIASIPESVKSLERTAQWEQIFTSIKNGGTDISETFLNDVQEFVRSVIAFENSPDRKRTPVHHVNPNAPQKEVIGICPRCGKNICEGKLSYYCESGKEGCGFVLWKEPKIITDRISTKQAEKLIRGETVTFKGKSKEGKPYTADFALEDTGKYINLKMIQSDKQVLGVCPRCGKNIYEGRLNFYCESGRDGCNFTLWKEDKYNGITVTAENAADLLMGKAISKSKKLLNGNTVKKRFILVDTGKYINLKEDDKE